MGIYYKNIDLDQDFTTAPAGSKGQLWKLDYIKPGMISNWIFKNKKTT